MSDAVEVATQCSRLIDQQIAAHVFGKAPCVFKSKGGFSAWATIWTCEHMTTALCYPRNGEAIDHVHSVLPRYSSEDGPAMEILAAWNGDVCMARQNGAWHVTLFRPSEQFDAWGATFPLAVCAARLKAAGVRMALLG